jgi:3D (Asp-Asp-Asp) domain-containing protein
MAKMNRNKLNLLFLIFSVFYFTSCVSKKMKYLKVDVSAYNSVAYQTDGTPTLTYWEDTLKPGMKAIAVSHDLVDSGLTHGTEVEIEGLKGTYIVRDLMDDRWKTKIDLYMGTNIDSAREWGTKELTIKWEEKE